MADQGGAFSPRRLLVTLAEKLELTPRSAMLASRYRVVRRLGNFAFALLMLSSVRRTKWLYSRARIPATSIASREPKPVTESDLQLCRRLLAAYKKVKERESNAKSTDGMWAWIFDARQHGLSETLESEDPCALAEVMASMFAEDFVLGMAPGPLIRQTDSRLGSRAWGLKCLDGVASLAETLGVVAVENPEQGGAGLAFKKGPFELFTALEAGLGFRVDFPNVGAPCGLAVGDRLITPDTPDQIYAAIRLSDAMDLHAARLNGAGKASAVVEIGGGYGAMCHWFLQRRKNIGSYTIVDLPIVNVLQGYFLGSVLGHDRVSLYGEVPTQVRIVPNLDLADVESPFGVLVNKDSMPEMPRDTMLDYLKWGAANCEGLFYSYNQEAAMEFLGESQGVVHRAIAETGGFERLSRNRAWVREGYVEEIYAPKTAVVVSSPS